MQPLDHGLSTPDLDDNSMQIAYLASMIMPVVSLSSLWQRCRGPLWPIFFEISGIYLTTLWCVPGPPTTSKFTILTLRCVERFFLHHSMCQQCVIHHFGIQLDAVSWLCRLNGTSLWKYFKDIAHLDMPICKAYSGKQSPLQDNTARWNRVWDSQLTKSLNMLAGLAGCTS